MAAALEGADGVVHTAALVGDWGALEDFVAVNVRGTRNVLDAAGAARVVHVSSVATWGYEFRRDLDEDAPVRACGEPYVDTKAAAHVLALRRGAAVVRPGDVYGPRSVPWTLRPLQALRARTLVLPGRGDGLLTLVYVDDLVDCLVRALTHPARGRARRHGLGRPPGHGPRVLRALRADARARRGADPAGAAAARGRRSGRSSSRACAAGRRP